MWPEPVGLMTIGPRSSAIGLIAAAVEPSAVSSLESSGEFQSLSVLLEKNMAYEEAPELFCAGLLATHDLPVIRQLIPEGVLR